MICFIKTAGWLWWIWWFFMNLEWCLSASNALLGYQRLVMLMTHNYRINTSNSLCIKNTWSHRSFHTVQWGRWGIFQWESHRFWWLMKIHWWLPLLVCDHHWRMQWLTLLLIQTPAPDSEMWESCKPDLATWTRPPLLQHPHPVHREISEIYFNKLIIILEIDNYKCCSCSWQQRPLI